MTRFSWLVALTTFAVHVGSIDSAHAAVADGLKCYRVTDLLLLQGVVELTAADLGLSETCKVKRTKTYCVPVDSEVVSATHDGAPVTPLSVSGPNPGDRICYKISCPGDVPTLPEISDAFGTRTLAGVRATTLCVPAVVGPAEEPAPSGGVCSAEVLSSAQYVVDCNVDAGHEVTGTVAPVSGEPELHIISIYGTTGGVPANVSVERTERTVLVLAAFDPVQWNVTTAPNAKLERVIVTGYEQQQVTVPDGVVVENRSPYPANLGSEAQDFEEYPAIEQLWLLLDSEEATGLCMTSLHACYEATQFRIPPRP